MFAALLLLAAPAFAADTLLVEFLDVGQGDGVLIQTPDGHNVLIDGGRPGAHVEDLLLDRGVDHLDLLVASHADYDHSGGHEAVLGELSVDAYVTNGLDHTSQSYGRITELSEGLAAAGSLELRSADSYLPGDDLGVDDLHLYILPPPASIGGTNQNSHSIGIVVEYNGFKALITGDSLKNETAAWLADPSYDDLLADVDVYKAIHHGASNGDADNYAWLDLVQPENVVVQVGKNGYGHPTMESLETYDLYAAETWRNDQDGDVRVEVWETGGYTVESEVDGVVGYVSADPVPSATAWDCPATHPVKGNIGSRSRVYHVPGGVYYSRTQPEECFVSGDAAAAGGFRASSR
jgi:competence protein ComEC